MLYINFITNPLALAIGPSPQPSTVFALTNITSSFDLMMTCEADSLWFYVNGQPVTSIVSYHVPRSDVPPLVAFFYSSASGPLYVNRISWNFGTCARCYKTFSVGNLSVGISSKTLEQSDSFIAISLWPSLIAIAHIEMLLNALQALVLFSVHL